MASENILKHTREVHRGTQRVVELHIKLGVLFRRPVVQDGGTQMISIKDTGKQSKITMHKWHAYGTPFLWNPVGLSSGVEVMTNAFFLRFCPF